jgi:hypothetical protein
MTDRRDPARQTPRPVGRRATDPTLTTRDCANQLGVSPGFVVGEIRDGRLLAQVLERPGRKAVYRVSILQLKAYQGKFCWTATAPAQTLLGPVHVTGAPRPFVPPGPLPDHIP